MTVRCPNKGCPERMERRFIEAHSNDECPKLIVACQHCERKVRREDERTHERQCPRRPVPCPNSCGKSDMPAEQVRTKRCLSTAAYPCASMCMPSDVVRSPTGVLTKNNKYTLESSILFSNDNPCTYTILYKYYNYYIVHHCGGISI